MSYSVRLLVNSMIPSAKTFDDRRAVQRKFRMCRIEVEELREGSSIRTQTGLQADMSAAGVSIMVRNPIPVGTRVNVHQSGRTSHGAVQRCCKENLEYSVAVRFDRAPG